MGQPKERTLPFAPIQEVSGAVYDAPNVLLMDQDTGKAREFDERGRNPNQTFNVLGYSEARCPTFMSKSGLRVNITSKIIAEDVKLSDLASVIQGNHNKGFQFIYLFPTDEAVD